MRLKHECLFAVFCYYANHIDWINYSVYMCMIYSIAI